MQLTIGELCGILGGRLRSGADGARPACVGPVVTDSRQVEPGDVFWALVGPRHHGGDYCDEAFARGAAGVVVAGRDVHPPRDRWVLEVADAGEALQKFAAWKRSRFTGTVVAVTGSVGKTTTRQMIDTVLRWKLNGTASRESYNNHVGVPLSVLGIEASHQYAVLELGGSAAGEIKSLARLCLPQIGVITQVAEAHLAGFGSLRGVAEAKAELLAELPRSGCAVLNGDDPWLRRMAAHCRAPIVWFGRSGECDVAAADVQSQRGWLQFTTLGQKFRIPVWGRHHLTGALAAIAVGKLHGIGLSEMADALHAFSAVQMRCEVKQLAGATVINDAYNANPCSMRAALDLLRDTRTSGRRIVVCGDMRELGSDADRWHRRLGAEVVTRCGADLLLACGQHAADVVAGALEAGMPVGRTTLCRDVDETAGVLRSAIRHDDVVLIKGSRAMAMDEVVQRLEQETLRQAA